MSNGSSGGQSSGRTTASNQCEFNWVQCPMIGHHGQHDHRQHLRATRLSGPFAMDWNFVRVPVVVVASQINMSLTSVCELSEWPGQSAIGSVLCLWRRRWGEKRKIKFSKLRVANTRKKLQKRYEISSLLCLLSSLSEWFDKTMINGVHCHCRLA